MQLHVPCGYQHVVPASEEAHLLSLVVRWARSSYEEAHTLDVQSPPGSFKVQPLAVHSATCTQSKTFEPY
jgi:hypothetical protein